ncbi:MAG: phosphate/phosphite/phosphonate ABC transporter substrate-binding protein [Sulfurimonas sp.]|nr:phosphate/phosphite/phosphonate ABC transporter substrate-binding protein [Sulfurimonas sp.]
MKHLLLFLLTLYLTPIHAADIVMGIVPQQSPLKLLKAWSPITKYLSKQTGENIIFKTETSITKFEKVLYSGGYDFAYMNPYHFIVANQTQGYEAKLRAQKNIKGILVMQKGRSIDDIKKENVTYLFPAPNAFAATLLTKYDLLEKHGVPIEVLNKAKYVNSHDSVYKGVSRGLGDIGGGIERTFRALNDKTTKESLTVVYTTKAYPSHPFAFNPNMKEETKKKIIHALMNIPSSYLQKLKIKKLRLTENEEYKPIIDLAVKLKVVEY